MSRGIVVAHAEVSRAWGRYCQRDIDRGDRRAWNAATVDPPGVEVPVLLQPRKVLGVREWAECSVIHGQLDAEDRGSRGHNWVEQQGKSVGELDARWYDDDYWTTQFHAWQDWDRSIEEFNQRTGLLARYR